MTTYEFYDNGNTIRMIKNVDGKITTTNFNKRNVSVTTGGNPELFEISDLRGSACPYYTEVTIPTSTSLDDLRSQINTWLDNINVEATIEVDSTGLATIVKQDEQIVILNSLDSKLNSLGQKPSSGSAPVVLSTEQEAILEAIKTAVQGIDLDTNGLAKDATLLQTNNLLTAIDLVLDSIDASIDVNLSTRASEATLELARLLLVSIDNKVATENTLLAAKGVLDNLLISTQNIEGYTDGLEALITATNTKLDTIITNTTGLATETTLAGIKSQTDKLTFNASNELIVEATIDPTGLATEAKQDVQIANQGSAGTPAPFGTGILGWLRGIWDRLNQFQFTGGKLDVNASVSIESKFGDTATVSTVALTDISAAVLSADTDRKQIVFFNSTNDFVYLFYGTPAVAGKGITLAKKETFIEDVYRGQVTAIMDTGKSGNLEVTDITL